MARRRHEVTIQTRRTVESMSAYGIPQPDIARVLGIGQDTLVKYYRDELDLATAKANSKVAESLYKKALGDGPASVTAAIFWMKTRGQWKETVVNEHTGKGGGPIQTEDVTHGAESFARRMASLAARSVPDAGNGETDAAGDDGS